MKNRYRKARNPFAEAVRTSSGIADCYQPGLQALGSHSQQVVSKNTRLNQGSVSLDACLQASFPNDSRWDYALGYAGRAYFVEVHPAYPSEVKAVLKKLEWLKTWLQKNAPGLESIKAKNAFYWLASDKVGIPSTAREYKQAAQAGLVPKRRLQLP
jgi:hypothetical protein